MIYAAKSTEDKHGSIPTQLEDCRQMAEREGWTVVGEFHDAVSALSRQPWPRGSPRQRNGRSKQRPSMGDAWSSLRMPTGSLEVPAADTSPAPCGTAPAANDRFHAQHVTGPHDRIGDRAVFAIAVSASWSLPRWLADVRTASG
jgi:hypothetical protein